jgi:NAD(P)-dependent dehydrogenase (short-subunit alcohol dehydrogenase family)
MKKRLSTIFSVVQAKGAFGVFSIKNKVTIITGGTAGIGKAAVERFADAGAKVVFAGRRSDGSRLATKTGSIFVKTDVSIESQVERLVKTAVESYGGLDVLINNAGIGDDQNIKDITEENFDRVQSVNTKGVLWGMKHAAPHMSSGGSIINCSSAAGKIAFPGYGSYSSSKFAIIGLTQTAALEFAPLGIRVNAVLPGTFDTESPGSDLELAVAKFMHPMGRIGKPEEVAGLYHFLASDESAFITGASIPIDGGILAGIGLGMIEPLVGIASS